MKHRMNNTFKFRLALTFSAILFVFASTIIVLFTIAIDNYLSTRQEPSVSTSQPRDETRPKPAKDSIDGLRARYSQDLETVQQASVYMLGALAICSLIIGYAVADRFLRPLNKLNTQLGKLSQHNLGAQITDVPRDEFGITIGYFNDMSRRLQQSFVQQEQFIQDASHELRTPLTIVRTTMDTVLDNPRATTAELRTAMEDALRGIDDATTLANDLLTLTQPDTMRDRSIVDINDIVSTIVASYQHIARARSIRIITSLCEKPLPVVIQPLAITRAIRNICDNAFTYVTTAEAPTVTIRTRSYKQHAIITIMDNGPGIPRAYQAKIFDRFVRVDESRDKHTGGFGLGLAISKKIITEHGGTIALRSVPGATTFTITLPNAQP